MTGSVAPPLTIAELNRLNRGAFVGIVGPVFEHSPWIADRAWGNRPFSTLQSLHRSLCSAVEEASEEEQLGLIRAHPDLVGAAARAGKLTSASRGEQASAGLGELSSDEIDLFERYNQAYRERFGFPFVICARENKKEAILKAFPIRTAHSREEEIATALKEIEKIAWLRLLDLCPLETSST
jgi:2-oxo-4-hydroxy-4-carboxy-5-ureidoimidazoline decarboxylase